MVLRIENVDDPGSTLGKQQLPEEVRGNFYGKIRTIKIIESSEDNKHAFSFAFEAVIPQNTEEYGQLLKNGKFTPLYLDTSDPSQIGTTIDPKKVAFVAVESLQAEGLIAEPPTPSELPAWRMQNGHLLIHELLDSAISDEVLLETLKEKLEMPVSDETMQRAKDFEAKYPKVTLIAEQRDQIRAARIMGSITYRENPAAAQRWDVADTYLREKAQNNAPLSLDDLCHVNNELLDETFDELGRGQLREYNISVGNSGLRYPNPDHVPEMMEETLNWINDSFGKMPSIALAALTFQRLVSIHPFVDANGRTCRLVMDYVLQRAGLPPAMMGDDVDHALFGDQPVPLVNPPSSPTIVVEALLSALEKSYNTLEIKEKETR